ncbi:MAG: HEAT repeat domain-containing protein [Chthoniobacter sp.]
MRILFVTLLTILSLVSAHGEIPQKTLDELLRSVRAELPKGWTGTYDEKQALLVISRDAPVASVTLLPDGRPASEKPQPRKFTMSFQLLPSLSQDEYRRLTQENTQTRQAARAIFDRLEKEGVPQRGGLLLPRTAEEKAEVAKIEALGKTLRDPPPFYFRDITLQWQTNPAVPPGISVRDERAFFECQRVQQNVVARFSTYQRTEMLAIHPLRVKVPALTQEEIVQGVASGHPETIYQALLALQRSRDFVQDCRDPRLLEPFWNILLGPELSVRVPSNNIIGYTTATLKPDVRNLLAKSDGEVVALARQNIGSADPLVRAEAVGLFARFTQPVPEALAPLQALLRDDSQPVRMAALAALGKQDSPASPRSWPACKRRSTNRTWKRLMPPRESWANSGPMPAPSSPN